LEEKEGEREAEESGGRREGGREKGKEGRNPEERNLRILWDGGTSTVGRRERRCSRLALLESSCDASSRFLFPRIED